MDYMLPKDYRLYIDKYFLRAKEILIKENLNPIVKAQVFIRQGKCKVYGIAEAISLLKHYNPHPEKMKIFALQEGDFFIDGECLMLIEAPIQDIIDLETMYLGVLSSNTSIKNGGSDIDLRDIYNNMKAIVDLIAPRSVSYFGARHWHWNRDFEISKTCFEAGALNCSTDIGAINFAFPNDEGIGTIPHALECIYHWKGGLENAVLESTKAFDKYMNKEIPRIALIDYANREITDSLAVANMVNAVRVDTCGENFMQGVIPSIDMSRGVSVEGVYILRKILPEKIKIILSSGFGNIEKVKLFLHYENVLGIKLFDSLGVGGVFESRMATMDIIEAEGKEIHKVGRNPKEFSRLVRIL